MRCAAEARTRAAAPPAHSRLAGRPGVWLTDCNIVNTATIHNMSKHMITSSRHASIAYAGTVMGPGSACAQTGVPREMWDTSSVLREIFSQNGHKKSPVAVATGDICASQILLRSVGTSSQERAAFGGRSTNPTGTPSPSRAPAREGGRPILGRWLPGGQGHC